MKKFKIKALFANHIEKIVFGLFVVIVLAVLGTTKWGADEHKPEKLKKDIQKVRDSIDTDNPWIDQASFKVVDYTDKARQLFSTIPLDRYYFSTQLFYPLNQVDEPRKEPIFEPVQSLIAKAGLVTISVHVESDPASKDKSDQKIAAAVTAPKDDDSEFVNRGLKPGGTTEPGALPPGAVKGNMFGRSGQGRGVLDDDMGGRNDRADRYGSLVATNTSALSAGTSPRGVRVVSVRGVFPLKQQLENYRKALHITAAEASRDFEIADFILERQTARQGSQPWKDSEWKAVSIESAAEVLLESSEIDREDPVPIAMKDPVITMDLPSRLIGVWGDYATHPRIKGELLKEEDLKNQNLLLDSLDATASEAKISDAAKPRRRGLAAIQSDVKGLVKQIRSDPQATQRMKENFSDIRQRRGGMARRQGMEDDMPGMFGNQKVSQLIADSNYLLFRYLDFDVQSGFAYRYRVRLKLRNPNVDVAPELLGGADPNIANGNERDTPWSNISDVAVVPRTVEYFLENVVRDPYRDEKYKVSEANPVAQLAIFNWDTNFGTYVTTNALTILNIGAYIGDEKRDEEKKVEKKPEKKEESKLPAKDKIPAKDKDKEKEKETKEKKADKKYEHKVLDLSLGGLVTKKYFFSTLDLLIDVEPDAEIIPDQHPELKFAMDKGRGGSSRVNLLEDALVTTSYGELKTLDPISQKPEKDRLAERVKRERHDFTEIKIAKKEEGADQDTPRRRFRQRGRGGMGGGRGGGRDR